MKLCIHCQSQLPDDAEFCPQCGNKQVKAEEVQIGSGPKLCPRCQTPITRVEVKFCPACGFPLTQVAPTPAPHPEPLPAPQPASTPDREPTPPSVQQSAPVSDQQTTPPPATPVASQAVPQPTSLAEKQPDQEGGAASPSPKGSTAGSELIDRLKAGAGTPETPKPSNKTEKHTKKSSVEKSKLKKYRFIFGGIIVTLLVLLGVFAYKNCRHEPIPYEACRPEDIPEDYEAANQSDLEGDLKRDSYFKANQEYTIAPHETLRIPEGRTLIIQPGVRIRFGEGSRLVVEGTLSACGKTSRKILFNADTEAGSPGFWSGIELVDADSDTVIGNANVEFAGYENHAAIWVQGSNIQLENISFSSNQWVPLSLDPNSELKLGGSFEVENGIDSWEVRGGDLTGTRTWDFHPEIIVNGIVKIIEDAELNLPAGVMVKFMPSSAFHVIGDLTAEGSRDEKVILTSVNDGGEAGAPKPEAGNWIGIIWEGHQGNSSLNHVEVRYAGGASARGNTSACLYLIDASPILESVSVTDCASYSLSTDLSSTPQISDLTLDTEEPSKRWELRESKIEGVNTYTLASIKTSDDAPLDPYVTGWIGVSEAATLVIDAGTNMLFANGNHSGLRADGVLEINGTEQEPVVMTSWRDPQVGGPGQPSAGDWGGLHINRGQSDETMISWLNIRFAGAVENTCLRLSGASPRLENISIEHCLGYPLSSYATAQPVIENLSLVDNALGDVWEIRATDLTELRTLTWEPVVLGNGKPLARRVTGRILVDKEATLELSSGLTLGFGGEGYLLVRGGIRARGTVDEPILLTSWRDPEINPMEGGAQPGDWPGLILEGTREGQILEYLTIRYAGSVRQGISCFSLNKASPSVDNVEVSNCSYYPISSDMNSDPQIGEMTLHDNQLGNAWVVYGSTLERGNTRGWQAIAQAGGGENLTRLVTGRLTIESGATLKLEPGVVLRFTEGQDLVVNGSLQVAGSSQAPVIFTSWRDPEYSDEGGVQAGDWAGLRLENPQGQVSFDKVEIRYAGRREAPLMLINAAPSLQQVLIRDSSSYPISIELQSNPQWGAISLVNNSPADAIEVRSSHLERAGELIWNPLKLADGREVVRVVTGMLYIDENSLLRLDPQTVVKFTSEGGIEVRGGITTNQAVFTSFYDDEYGGQTDSGMSGDPVWQGIRLFTQKPVMFQGTSIRYASTGVWMENSSPVFSKVFIENCFETALSADLASSPRFEEIFLEGSPINGMVMRVTTLPDGETRWQRLGSGDQVVRVFLETFTIGPASQLYIMEGVVLKFGSQGSLIVEGQLSVMGNELAPVIFTALSDDSAAGDSDASDAPPNRGTWSGLFVNPNGTGAILSLLHTEIRYAINGLYLVNLPVWFYDGLVISDSLFFGISCDALSMFTLTEENILFINNGSESLSCPTPDR